MMQQDIQQALRDVKNGDTEKYRIIVERYHTGLIIYCEKLTSNRTSAEDIAQQAFINAYDKLDRFNDTKASFSTWLYRIAHNLCIDYLRQQHQTADYDISEFPDPAWPADLSYDEVESIRSAVDRLEPPVHAEAVRAYYWHGKSYKQIAHDHKTSVNTVASWIRRAKIDLRKELA